MKSPTVSPHGFSLIEIVLAMGVVSITVVAILGLLSVGFKSGKSSLDENLVAAMSRQVIGSLRQQRFSANPLFTSVAVGGAPTTIQTAYFDANGTRLLAANGIDDITSAEAVQQRAIYQCIVTAVGVTKTSGDSEGLGPAPQSPMSLPAMLDLNLTFTWPVGAKTTNAFSIRAGLARYY